MASTPTRDLAASSAEADERVIGCDKTDLDTPALLLDLDVMERNIARMAATCREAGIGWRPHTKAIKVPALAHKLLAAGAFGVTCAKLGEAEVMAAGGVRDILIANQIVGSAKIERLMRLLEQADVIVAVDNPRNVRDLDRRRDRERPSPAGGDRSRHRHAPGGHRTGRADARARSTDRRLHWFAVRGPVWLGGPGCPHQ